MEIQEAQKRKRETEAQILAIIQAFEQETGTSVNSVNTETVYTMGCSDGTISVRLSVWL